MKDLFSLLNARERRLVSVLGIALAAAACVLIFIAFKERGAAGRAAAALTSAEQNYQSLSRSRSEVKKEWQRSVDAQKDMAALKSEYFYAGRNAIEDFRLDLQRLFDRGGIAVADIAYGYAELVKGGIRKITAEFKFSGNYMTMKRFLDMIERHRRFLHVEKIDFLAVGKQPGLLDLKIGLAGYYEN
jgi:hypothetical protein